MIRGHLVLCGTPIGHLGDASPRLGEALESADAIFAEGHPTGAGFSWSIWVCVPDRSHTSRATSRGGQDGWPVCWKEAPTVALISDAGMPGVADPGLTAVPRRSPGRRRCVGGTRT